MKILRTWGFKIPNADKRYLIFDYETFSETPLDKCGAYEYARHKSTEILCVAFAIGTKSELKRPDIKIWIPEKESKSLGEFLNALLDPEIDLVAHNAFFEQCITNYVFGEKYMYTKKHEIQNIPLTRWHCTAARARALGLPGKLELVGKALNLKHQKDLAGHKVMLRLCKPKKPSKKNPSTREQNPELYQKLYSYCQSDIKSEIELFLKLPPLHPYERKLWLHDQTMNHRGFLVDRKLVKNALMMTNLEAKNLDKRIVSLTKGLVQSARQRDASLLFLKQNGLTLPNLQAQTVEEVLQDCENGICREFLELRQAVSKSSTAKYKAFDFRSRFDGRARENTIYYGAHTGRQSGTGLQPHNLFKSVLPKEDLKAGIDLIRNGDIKAIEVFFKNPMKLFASAIRGSIIASSGHTLDVGDFSTIELRVLFWLANHEAGLTNLKTGKDLYVDLASKVYNEEYNELLKRYKANDDDASKKRQLGKQGVLGAGFGIGINGKKFQQTCKSYGIKIDIDLAKKVILAYRKLHAPIPEFWKKIERSFFKVLLSNEENPTVRLGHLIFYKTKNFIGIKLPSGRSIKYFRPGFTTKQTLYGPTKQLYYHGIRSPSKTFGPVSTWGGTLTENVVQAVARDVLMEALLRVEQLPCGKPVLAVHDEIVFEREKNKGSLELFLKTMSIVPSWASGLPIKVEGWSDERYRK